MITVAAKVGDQLRMNRGKFAGETDLSELKASSLIVSRKPDSDKPSRSTDPIWLPGASLKLRNARVGALKARMPESWRVNVGEPIEVDLQGFRYDLLGGLHVTGEKDLAAVDSSSMVQWVRNGGAPKGQQITIYKPQPFRALETAFRNMGAESAADEVAYAKLLHRAETRPDTFRGWLGWAWDQILRFVVGFGIYPEYALIWFAILVLIGTGLGNRSKQEIGEPLKNSSETKKLSKTAKSRRTVDSFFYSLENSIPLMQPSVDNYKIVHANPRIRWFFHFQKVFGFFLASVFISSFTFGA